MRCVVTNSLLSYRSHFPCHHGRGDTGEGQKAGAGVFSVTTGVVTRGGQAPNLLVTTRQERFSWRFAGRGAGLGAFLLWEALLGRSARVVTKASMPALDFVITGHHEAGGRGRGDDRLPVYPEVCHHEGRGRGGCVATMIASPPGRRGDHDRFPSWTAWRRLAKTRVNPCHHCRREKCISSAILSRGDRKPARRHAGCHHGGRGDGVVTSASVIGASRRNPCRHGRGDTKPLANFFPVATVVVTHRSTAEFVFVTTGG